MEQRSCTMTADAIEEAQSEKMVCGYLFLESPDKDSPKANSLLSWRKLADVYKTYLLKFKMLRSKQNLPLQ